MAPIDAMRDVGAGVYCRFIVRLFARMRGAFLFRMTVDSVGLRFQGKKTGRFHQAMLRRQNHVAHLPKGPARASAQMFGSQTTPAKLAVETRS